MCCADKCGVRLLKLLRGLTSEVPTGVYNAVHGSFDLFGVPCGDSLYVEEVDHFFIRIHEPWKSSRVGYAALNVFIALRASDLVL